MALCRNLLPPLKVLQQAKDQRILSLILSSLSEEAMAAVVGLPTSCDVWLALERAFSHGSKTREIRLNNELQLMKKGSRSIVDFSRDFKSLCDQLLAIGCPVDEVDKSHWFLHGFGTDFAGFSSMQLLLQPPDPHLDVETGPKTVAPVVVLMGTQATLLLATPVVTLMALVATAVLTLQDAKSVKPKVIPLISAGTAMNAWILRHS